MPTAYYFSHDTDARGDEKMLKLRAKFGWAGYGIFWALCEMMFVNDSTSLQLENVDAIAQAFNVKVTMLSDVINYAIKPCRLFESDDTEFWSESLRRRKAEFIEKRKKYADAGRRGMEVRWGKSSNNAAPETPEKPRNNDDNNDVNNDDITSKVNKGKKERKGDKEKENKGSDSRGESPALTMEALISGYTTNEDLRAEIREFVKMRETIKKKLSVHALDLTLRDLNKVAANDPEKIATLQKGIKNSWQTIYELSAAEKASVRTAASASGKTGGVDYTKGWGAK